MFLFGLPGYRQQRFLVFKVLWTSRLQQEDRSTDKGLLVFLIDKGFFSVDVFGSGFPFLCRRIVNEEGED